MFSHLLMVIREKILRNILRYLQIASRSIYNAYPKLKSVLGFWSHRHTKFRVISQEQYLQDDVIANFQFQRLESY